MPSNLHSTFLPTDPLKRPPLLRQGLSTYIHSPGCPRTHLRPGCPRTHSDPLAFASWILNFILVLRFHLHKWSKQTLSLLHTEVRWALYSNPPTSTTWAADRIGTDWAVELNCILRCLSQLRLAAIVLKVALWAHLWSSCCLPRFRTLGTLNLFECNLEWQRPKNWV